MQRYFLNTYNGTGTTCDDEGILVADIAAAREHAITGIRSIIAEEVREGRLDLCGRIEIVDDQGRVVHNVAFIEAFALRLPQETP